MQVQAYLHFDGRCEEAIDFYTRAIGAKIDVMLRYRDSPEPPPPGIDLKGKENWVMHSNLRIGESQVMASDDCTGKHQGFHGFQLTLNVADETEAKRCYAALSDGGQTRMPLTTTFFSPAFGMLTDRFGVSWIVIVPQPG